jgi:hypothetical protein
MEPATLIQTIQIGIAVFAYVTILFLTYRDLRIFRRTGYLSYRKGALKGIIASTVVLIGLFLFFYLSTLICLALVFVGLMINQKGKREQIFTTAGTWARFTGKTDIVRTHEEMRADYERIQAEKTQTDSEKKQMKIEKEKNERREKRKEQREQDEE